MISKDTENLFVEVERFVADSRAMLQSGAMLEMQGLDEQVRALCEAVLQLSQEERIAASDRMQTLLGDLKSLGDAMVAARDELAEELRQVNTHKQAHHAYKTADSRDDFGRRSQEDED